MWYNGISPTQEEAMADKAAHEALMTMNALEQSIEDCKELEARLDTCIKSLRRIVKLTSRQETTSERYAFLEARDILRCLGAEENE